VVILAAALLVASARSAWGQLDGAGSRVGETSGVEPSALARRLPFGAGERLSYTVRLAGMGAAGKGVMSVSGPMDIRGVDVLLLKSEMRISMGPITGVGRTQSWLDADRMAVLRFSKDERRVFTRHRENVEVFPESRRWTGSDGSGGATPTDAPLDELSFIYFVRTLPLTADTTFEVSRHFDAGRNPVGLRILGRETISTKAGTFQTVLVEMRVKDPRNYRGEGVIRIHLTDDDCRLPVRIESTMPDVGKMVLMLESATTPGRRCVTSDQ
jgi:hypothetical protein